MHRGCSGIPGARRAPAPGRARRAARREAGGGVPAAGGAGRCGDTGAVSIASAASTGGATVATGISVVRAAALSSRSTARSTRECGVFFCFFFPFLLLFSPPPEDEEEVVAVDPFAPQPWRSGNHDGDDGHFCQNVLIFSSAPADAGGGRVRKMIILIDDTLW